MRGAEVHGDVICPECDRVMERFVIIIWGRTPPGRSYEIGDSISWVKQRSGRLLPPYNVRRDGVFNFGDPNLSNVLIMDDQDYAPDFYPSCPHCKCELDGAAAVIKENQITGIKVFLRGQLSDLQKARKPLPSVVEVDKHGKFISRYDLSEHVYHHLE